MKTRYFVAGGLIVSCAGLGGAARLYRPAHAGQNVAAAVSISATTLPSPAHHRPWQGRFPNVELQTHEGKTVRFYDDLIKGKLVAINFMYATCKKL
jgi:protein SCO1/2